MFLTVMVLGMSLLLLVSRLHQPWVAPPPGAVLGGFPVPLRVKVRLQRPHVYALAAILLLGSAGGWIPPLLEVAVILLALGILLLPVRYTLTDQAIALGRTPFRPWTDFAGLDAGPGRVALLPRAGSAGLTVWLSGATARDPRVALMARLIAGAAPQPAAPAAMTSV